MPKKASVLENETIDAFAKRVGIAPQTVLDLNQDVLSDRSLTGLGGTALGRKNWLAGIPELNVPDSAVVQAGPAAAGGPAVAPEPLLGLENSEYNWLTYETLFNQRPYRKANRAGELGLYRIPLKSIKVWLRDGVEPAVAKELSDAFFPELDPDWVKALSTAFWKWKPKTPSQTLQPNNPDQDVANRLNNPSFQKQYAVLPFNFADNGDSSNAIGCRPKTEFGADLGKLQPTWRFWKTASRSLVVQLQRVKGMRAPWQSLVESTYQWTLAKLQSPFPPENVGKFERERNLRDEFNARQEFKLGGQAGGVYGVKTGVQYVGCVDQQGVHKDKLEENSVIACLRSDFIVEMDRKAARANPKADREMVIQTELLSITEMKGPTDPAFGDGVQVRDLSVLDKTKIYVPPISIPFLGLDLKTLKRRFECVTDPAWRTFWQSAYAERLGVAKALLLLRYGLQMGSPNAQNFLMEFNPPAGQGAAPTPSGKVIIRDVGDMYLHREVLWARLGGQGLPSQSPDDKKKLNTLRSNIIKYECNELAASPSQQEEWRNYVPYETGSLYEASYGPRGTRFHWFRFSTLSKGSSVFQASSMGTDPDAYSQGWPEVLATLCEWGLAHNKAYVARLQTALNLDFGIVWDDNAPARYRQLAPTDRANADTYYRQDLAAEDLAANTVHAVLASQRGQDALKAFVG